MESKIDFEKAWLDVYYMLEDNALDHARCMYLDDGDIIVDGVRWSEVVF